APRRMGAQSKEDQPKKSFPRADAFHIKRSYGNQRHTMFRQGKKVVHGVVVGIADDHKLPGQSKIKVEADPPEEQQQKVQSAKPQIARSGFGLGPERQGG